MDRINAPQILFPSIKIIYMLLVLVLFLIWPLGGFLLSLKYFKGPIGALSFIAFGVFINMNFIIRPQEDMYRILGDYNYVRDSLEGIFLNGELYYSGTIKFIEYLGLSEIHVYLLWSIVYYFFAYLALRQLCEIRKNNLIGILLIISATLFINPTSFLGLRFFTAAWLFIANVGYVEYENKPIWYVLPIFCTPFIHFMFWPIVILYLIFKISRPSVKLLLIIFVITWGISFLDLGAFIRNLGLYEGSRYLSEARNSDMDTAYSYGKFLYIPMQFCIWYMLYLQVRSLRTLDETNERLLKLGIFAYIFLNLVSTSWDFTFRFRQIAPWLAIFSIAYYHRYNRGREYNFFALCFFPAILFWNWDLFFVSGSKVFQMENILFSNFFICWDSYIYQINSI